MNQQAKTSPYTYWVAFVATLGGFLQSYVSCAIAGALIFIARDFNLSPAEEGHLASMILLGALAGSCCAGSPTDWWGRRRMFLLSAILYCLSSLALFFTDSYPLLLLFRFITGLAMGITALVGPLYLAEIAPAKSRGAFVTAFQFSVTLGTLIAYLGNYAFYSSGDWRSMLGLAALPAAFQLLCFFSFPETPKWLFAHGQFEKGNEMLQRLQGIQIEHTEPGHKEPNSSWKEILNPIFKKGILIGVILSLFQQFCGVNAIVFFAPKIFGEAGIDNAMFSMLLIGIVNFLSTFIPIFLIDHLGRKKLLLISQSGIVLSLLVIVWGFATKSQWIDLLAVAATLTFIGSYALGTGPITWVLISEIYPLSIRAKAMSVMTFLSWLSTYTVVLTFPPILSALGPSLTFTFFFLLATLALLLYWRLIPETKGKTLEQIEKMLYSKD